MLKLKNATEENTEEWRQAAKDVIRFGYKSLPALHKVENKIAWSRTKLPYIAYEDLSEIDRLSLYTSLPWMGADEEELEEVWKPAGCGMLCILFMSGQASAGVGNLHPDYLVVKTAHDWFSERDGEDTSQFHRAGADVTPFWKYVKRALLESGLLSKCYFTNIMKCAFAEDNVPKLSEATDKNYDICLQHLFEEIQVLKPKKILALGKDIFSYLGKKDIPVGVVPLIDPEIFLKNSNKASEYSAYIKSMLR